jgi:hypothetical protein
MDDEEDRIRVIFGLTSDDPLPEVTEESLRRYHRHLETHLAFPFHANYVVAKGPFEEVEYPVSVAGLSDPEDCDTDEGIRCEARQQDETVELPLIDIHVANNQHNQRLIDDYGYWFWNFHDDTDAPGGEDLAARIGPPPAVGVLGWVFNMAVAGAVGGSYGAVVGAALAALDGALVAVRTGAILVGLLGCWLGASFGTPPTNRTRLARCAGGFVGGVVGAAVGGLLGAMLIAFLGTVLGGLVGAVIGTMLGRKMNSLLAKTLCIGAGAMLGVVGQAWRQDAEEAWTGIWQGGLAGAVAAPVLWYAMYAGLVFMVGIRARR